MIIVIKISLSPPLPVCIHSYTYSITDRYYKFESLTLQLHGMISIRLLCEPELVCILLIADEKTGSLVIWGYISKKLLSGYYAGALTGSNSHYWLDRWRIEGCSLRIGQLASYSQ